MVIDPFSSMNWSPLSVDPQPIITKDGVTVASHVQLFQNKLQNIGAKLMLDAA